jgi:hypothetical protein
LADSLIRAGGKYVRRHRLSSVSAKFGTNSSTTVNVTPSITRPPSEISLARPLEGPVTKNECGVFGEIKRPDVE